MALVIGDSQVKYLHHYIQDSSILNLSYPGSRVDQLWSKLEDIAIIVIILGPGCQQPFLLSPLAVKQDIVVTILVRCMCVRPYLSGP